MDTSSRMYVEEAVSEGALSGYMLRTDGSKAIAHIMEARMVT